MKIFMTSIWLTLLICFLSIGKVVAQDQPNKEKQELIEKRITEFILKIMEKVDASQNEELKVELELAIREVIAELEEVDLEELEFRREIKEAVEEAIEESLEEGMEIDDEVDTMIGEALDGLDISFKKKERPLGNVKTRWLMFDLGFATYGSENSLPEINGVNPMDPDIINSVSWNLHILKQRFNMISHKVNFIYGVGLSFNYYGFAEPVTLDSNSPEVTFLLDDENNASFKKNHMRAAYLHIPVMLNFESNPAKRSKSFHFNAGMYGNVLLGGKTVQKSNGKKIKVKDNFHLNNFQYGLLANIGYGPVTFYGTYGLNELFRSNKDAGYSVRPITFGLQIVPF